MLTLSSLSAYAVPNIWKGGEKSGWITYVIENEKNQQLLLGCNEGGNDPDDIFGTLAEHQVHFYPNTTDGDDFVDLDDNSLSFLVNDEMAVYPMASSRTIAGEQQWNEFIDAINIAEKIEVYVNNQSVALFYPKRLAKSRLNSLKHDCRPIGLIEAEYEN